MYKKQFAVVNQNLLSKKDLKSLKSQLVEQFASLNDKILDELLPEGQVKILKLDNRSLLYTSGDGPPAFFDMDGDLFPTLTTLWQHPYIMPELTIFPQVSKFVLNGADLMLPGVKAPANGVAGFGTVTKGQRRCIKIEGNPYPIAVGKMLVNQTQMEKLKGKGMEVIHVFRDALWLYSGKEIPNAGFTEKEDEVMPCSDATYKPGMAPAPATASGATAAGADDRPAADGSAASAGGGADDGSTPAVGSAPGSAGAGRAPEDWPQDDLLEFCFIQAFKLSLTDEKSLPVEASELYEKHMKPNRPEGTTLDVKKSSHKQIGKFLNAMRKAKVIDVLDKKGVISVTKVDRTSKTFVQLEEKYAADCAEAGGGAASSTAKPQASVGLPPPRITAMWKPSHYLENLFKEMGKSKSDLYPWDQARAVLLGYAEKQGLGSDPIKLDEELITALYRAAGAQKKGLTFPEEVELEELEEKMQERMQEYTTIEVAGLPPVTRKGPAMKIEVSLSRKGAHNVTRVCCLEAYGIDVTSLADELKKKMNCTVHVEDMPGKSTKDKMVQLQGHVAQELGDLLLERYGITKTFMSVK